MRKSQEVRERGTGSRKEGHPVREAFVSDGVGESSPLEMIVEKEGQSAAFSSSLR